MTNNFFAKACAIGVLLFIFCVAFEIHGSSINIYADALNHPELSGDIFRRYRPIRSDEWAVFTPFAFSQYFSNFSMISEIVRAVPTNMFMTYGQAVWHPALIYRPAQIGYLFLDQGSGLAFFWMGRLIALFLVSLIFADKILGVNKKLAVIYAIMVALSPVAQWWWAVNSIAEILAAGQGLVVCWKKYLETSETRQRFLFGVLFLWCAGIFIFGIYPAWQVAFGYVFLVCIIAVSVDEKASLKIFWQDKIFWLAGFVIMLLPIVHAVYVSQDMIKLTMETEYPGHRISLGGDGLLSWTLAYLIGIVLPFKTLAPNECELATFFCAIPIGTIFLFYLIKKLNVKDSLMIGLFIITILFLLRNEIVLPEFFAKLTLMDRTTGGRLKSAIDFAQMLMLFRGLTLLKDELTEKLRLILSAVVMVICAATLMNFFSQEFELWQIVGIVVFDTVAVFLIISPLNKLRMGFLILMMFFMGATVNPIAKGVDVLMEVPVGKKIAEISQQEKTTWLTIEAPENFTIIHGAPTINCCNIYPAFETWKKLDLNGENFKIYNRYAHILILLTNEPTKFTLVQEDLFKVDLNPLDLPKLNVTHIFSRNGELEKFSLPTVSIKKIYEENGNCIYKVDSTSAQIRDNLSQKIAADAEFKI